MKVMTTRGPLERSELIARDIPFESDEVRQVATEWRTLEGELVRRDVWNNALMPLQMASE